MRIPLHLIPIFLSWLILSPTAPAAPSLEEAWAALPGYTYGADRAPLVVLETHVWETAAKGDSAQRLQLGRRLADVLAGAATTPDARRFACQQLAIVGGAGEVPALAKWIDDARMGDAAILALARIPAPEAGAALRGALATSSGSVRTSVIAALGQRREADAVPALRQLAAGADRAVGDAAAAALALIGGKPAATALTELLSQAEAPRPALIDACLGVADGLAAAGEQEAAVALYRRLYAEPMPSLARAAALRGLAACEGAELRTQLWQALAGPDVEAARVAAECLPQLPAEPDGAALQQRLLSAPPALQVILLAGLAQHGRTDARPAALAAAKESHPDVQVAALSALGKLGDAASVPTLAAALDATAPAIREAAASALAALSAPGVDAALLAEIKTAPPARRARLAVLLGQRSAVEAVPDLLALAGGDSESSVRVAALGSLGALLSPDRAGDLLALLSKVEGEAERDALREALVAVLRGDNDVEGRVAPLIAAYPSVPKPAKITLLSALSRLGGGRAFDFVDKERSAADAELSDAAVRALADWPEERALETLLSIARTSSQRTQQVLALRGYIRLLNQSEEPAASLLPRYRAALEAAGRDEERRAVLAGVARFPEPAALELVKPCLASPTLSSDAGMAALAIIAEMKAADQRAARGIVADIAEKADNANLRRSARALLRRLE